GLADLLAPQAELGVLPRREGGDVGVEACPAVVGLQLGVAAGAESVVDAGNRIGAAVLAVAAGAGGGHAVGAGVGGLVRVVVAGLVAGEALGVGRGVDGGASRDEPPGGRGEAVVTDGAVVVERRVRVGQPAGLVGGVQPRPEHGDDGD